MGRGELDNSAVGLRYGYSCIFWKQWAIPLCFSPKALTRTDAIRIYPTSEDALS